MLHEMLRFRHNGRRSSVVESRRDRVLQLVLTSHDSVPLLLGQPDAFFSGKHFPVLFVKLANVYADSAFEDADCHALVAGKLIASEMQACQAQCVWPRKTIVRAREPSCQVRARKTAKAREQGNGFS